jgi:hypothetical protein
LRCLLERLLAASGERNAPAVGEKRERRRFSDAASSTCYDTITLSFVLIGLLRMRDYPDSRLRTVASGLIFSSV